MFGGFPRLRLAERGSGNHGRMALRAVEVAMTDEGRVACGLDGPFSRARETEPASRGRGARQMLLGLSRRKANLFFAVVTTVGACHHQTVQRCIEPGPLGLWAGVIGASNDPARPTRKKEPTITPRRRPGWVSLACRVRPRRLAIRTSCGTTRLLGAPMRRAKHGGGGGGHECPRQSCPRHGVQDSRPRGNQAAIRVRY